MGTSGDGLVYGVFGREIEEILQEHGYRSPPRVNSKLRGWRHRDRPVKPKVHGTRLPVSSIASEYCPTSRDLYLRRVMGVEAPPGPPLVRGVLYHSTLEAVVTYAKNLIYQGLGPNFELAYELPARAPAAVEHLLEREKDLIRRAGLERRDLEELRGNMLKLWRFESGRIVGAVAGELSRSFRVGKDSLVAHAVPLTVEHRVDGGRLGLSSYLSIDAFQATHPMILELKSGRERESHKLTLAGYALAFESAYKRPVNFGMLAYIRFSLDRPIPWIIRRVYPIDERLRRRFLEVRDWKLELVHDQRDPGLPKRCPSGCGFFSTCRRKS